jgi:predicted TIM-barrel fold metal-dependent hydrolase
MIGCVSSIVQTPGRIAGNPRQRPLEEYLRERFYVDVAVRTPAALACALETYGLDRVVFATDFPFADPLAHVRFLRANLPADELNTILNENRMPFPPSRTDSGPVAGS